MTRERLSEEERAIFDAVSDEFDIIEEVERILTARVTAARLAEAAAAYEAAAQKISKVQSRYVHSSPEKKAINAHAWLDDARHEVKSLATPPQVSALERERLLAKKDALALAWSVADNIRQKYEEEGYKDEALAAAEVARNLEDMTEKARAEWRLAKAVPDGVAKGDGNGSTS